MKSDTYWHFDMNLLKKVGEGITIFYFATQYTFIYNRQDLYNTVVAYVYSNLFVSLFSQAGQIQGRLLHGRSVPGRSTRYQVKYRYLTRSSIC